MTIKKQVDNLINWYEFNKPGAVDQVVLDCGLGTIRKFAKREFKIEQRIVKGKPKKVKIRGHFMYRKYKIIQAEKDDPRYKAQVDAFRSAVV